MAEPGSGTPADDLGLQVVDVGTWRVQTVDAVAERVDSSLDAAGSFSSIRRTFFARAFRPDSSADRGIEPAPV